MQQAISQLGDMVDYSVDNLCDLLGIPQNVYFKRMKVVDVSAALLRPFNSILHKTFDKCKEAQKGRETCVVFVAGNSSVVVTDMQVYSAVGKVHMYIRDMEDHDIHIFPIADATVRLPALFNHQET